MATKTKVASPAYSPSPVLSPTAAVMALEQFEEYRSQLWALGDIVLRGLAEACNEGGDPPDDAPLQIWRLMQVLVELLESNQPADSLRVYMGQHLLPSAEPAA